MGHRNGLETQEIWRVLHLPEKEKRFPHSSRLDLVHCNLITVNWTNAVCVPTRHWAGRRRNSFQFWVGTTHMGSYSRAERMCFQKSFINIFIWNKMAGTLQNPHIHTHTHNLQNPHIHTTTHYKIHTYTHPHIKKSTHTHTHTSQNSHIHTSQNLHIHKPTH